MISFRAHRAEVDQTGFTANAYSQVLFTSTAHDATYNASGYDYGGRFALSSSLWTPVAVGEPDAMVVFHGQLWIPDGEGFGANGNYYVARICKNGNQPAGVSTCANVATKGPFANDWVIRLEGQDCAQAGDAYGVFLFTSDGAITLNGNCLHTWWGGVKL